MGEGGGTGARSATDDEHPPVRLELEVVSLVGALQRLEARGARQRACNRVCSGLQTRVIGAATACATLPY